MQKRTTVGRDRSPSLRTTSLTLFLLRDESLQSRREAASYLRHLGVKVLAALGDSALIGIASEPQSEEARQNRRFVHATRKRVKTEAHEPWSEGRRRLVDLWNLTLSPEYRRSRERRPRVGSWGDLERLTPGPLLSYEPHRLLARVLEALSPAERRRLEDEAGKRSERLSPEQFVELERALTERTRDATLAHKLARAAYMLSPAMIAHLLKLPLDAILTDMAEADCWELEGEIAVGVVCVESSRPSGPTFPSSDRFFVGGKIMEGLKWLAAQAPVSAGLTWVFDFQFVKIDVANGSAGSVPDSAADQYWIDPGLAQVTFQGHHYASSADKLSAYRDDLRIANDARHAYVIFGTPYHASWFAYQSGRMVVISNQDDYGGWGIGHVDLIAAHETMHVFGTSDEYKGKGTPCSNCGGSFGCDTVPNGNCAVCSRPHQDCLMDGDVARICAYTQAQVGWADLLVELTTADVLFAGTDDDVWLDIGTRTFVLDTPDVDDRERNNIQAYALKDTGVTRADIQRIAIRKSADGAFGGWDLQRVRVWMDGELLCDEDHLNTWLENNHLVWVCPGFESPPDLVNSLVVKVTTGDVLWAGTDDDVTFKMGGQSWNLDNPDHDDFERGHTDTFVLDPGTGLLRSALSGVHIHKSPDGIAGGWFLKGLEIVVNGATVFNDQSINQWLEDDHRDWRGTI